MKLRGLLGVIFICLSLVPAVRAQQAAVNLGLDEALSAALKNNKNMELAHLDQNAAQAGYRQTAAFFLPQVALSYGAYTTNNPLNAFGFKLQEKSITQNDFDPRLLNYPNVAPDFATRAELQQPVLNMDQLMMRKGAKKQVEMYQYQLKRTAERITYEVNRAYLQLKLAYSARAVATEALATADSMRAYVENHYRQGLVPESDVLNARMEVAAAETGLQKAGSNIRSASDYLSVLMGRDAGTTYAATSDVNSAVPENEGPVKVSPVRADFMALHSAIDATDLAIKAGKLSALPRLNAFASYQYNDNRMLGFGANAYLAGAQLSWDIFRGLKNKNSIASRNVDRDKLATQLALQMEQSQAELNQALRDLDDAGFELKQQKTVVDLALESLRITRNRYEQGLASTTDLLAAQTQVARQKLGLAQAGFTLDVTRVYLQFLTSSSNK